MMRKIVFMLLCCLGSSLWIQAQESIPEAKDLSEEKNLRFQEYFFKALSNKATRNYQKAIGNLEMCNELLPNSATIYFEFSKNYFLLGRNQLAKEYISRALGIMPDNLWMQLHLVSIYKKERNFKEAIKVQKKLVNSHPKRQEELVYLYMQDRDYQQAIALLNAIEKERGLPKRMAILKQSLESRKARVVKNNTRPSDLKGLIAQFNKDNSFKNLLQLLDKSETDNKAIFDQMTEQGLELFPAQPRMYLYRARALSYKKETNNALTTLLSGIDFVIDNNSLLTQFYKEMAKLYSKLGNPVKEKEYLNKAKALNP